MSEQFTAEYYHRLEAQLKKLQPRLQNVMPPESWRWFEEWVRVGEYGLADEVAAEALTAAKNPPPELCRDVLSVAETMRLESEPILQLRQRMGLGERT